LAAYFRAAQTCPENPSGWTYMAYLQAYQLGTPREAIESFRLAIAAGNDGSPIYNELGMACGRCGLHDDARDAFIEGTNADPDDPLPWLNLGHSFMALGDADEAAGCFEHAAEFHDPRCHAAALEGLAAARDALAKG
jgi:Flp pilus assembly protein TadD